MPLFNPLDYPICFEHPFRLVSSTWIEHIPFGMFLIDVLRPRTLVELGTFRGVSYCCFCQAVRQLQLDTRCYAIDTWMGDPHNGFYEPSLILEELRHYHDPLYSGFSRLIQSTFDDSLSHFEDGTIDLLHIDGYHTYDAVRHDFEAWLPKMSERGVILLHDTNVREKDFGVWRLWNELKPHHVHFEFIHGHGLGVLILNGSQSSSLTEFTETADPGKIREFFQGLGYRLQVEMQLKSQSEQLTKELEEQREQYIRTSSVLLNLRSDLDAIYSSKWWRLARSYRAIIAKIDTFSHRSFV